MNIEIPTSLLRDKIWVQEVCGEVFLESKVRMWGKEQEKGTKPVKNGSLVPVPLGKLLRNRVEPNFELSHQRTGRLVPLAEDGIDLSASLLLVIQLRAPTEK